MVTGPPVRTLQAWAALLLAPTVWFVHFNAVYAAASIAIVAGGAPGAAARIAIAAATLLALAVVAACFILAPRFAPHNDDQVRRFWIPASRLLAAAAFVGIVYQALPALLIP